MGEVELGRVVTVGISDLREEIALGQLVERWTLEGRSGGSWRTLASGETIGYRKLDRFPPTRVDALRLTLHSLADPRPVEIHAYAPGA